MFNRIVANLSHPEHGWKTTHFWGPIANWGLVGAAVYDASFKGPEIIDVPMTVTMIGYSSLFMRFAWAVDPRNYLLFACHTFNVTAQVNQLRRAIEYKLANVPNAAEELTAFGQKMAATGVGLLALIASSGRIKSALSSNNVPEFVRKTSLHPAGPLTIFFWAPTSKWLLSANNLADLNKPTDKISFSQQLALTSTGLIWTRYATVINPVNYNLAVVNFVLALSSGYHLSRKVKADYMK
jgi:hypothetical protein